MDYPMVLSMDILIKCKCKKEEVLRGIGVEILQIGYVHKCPVCCNRSILVFSEFGNKIEHHLVEWKHVKDYHEEEMPTVECGEVRK